ncbi:MAG: GH32 C-terminal domain-containing protein, partial [Halanaerobium sp.]
LNRKKNKIIVDLSNSGNTDFDESFLLEKQVDYDFKENVKVNIFVDRSSIEVFLDGGEISITNLVFPELDSKEVKIRTAGSVFINNLEIFELDSIW